MKISIQAAARQLEERGMLQRERNDYSDKIIQHVRDLLGRELPPELVELYQERIAEIGEFTAMTPLWSERVGWRSPDSLITQLLHADAVPLFDDGCGNLFGLDLTPGLGSPAVYFFDHELGFEKPEWAAGSSLAVFLLLLADSDRAYAEKWPDRWELEIDPDIDKCPRAPAIWDAG